MVEAAFAAEGVAAIAGTAIDAAGQSATVGFTVRVEFHRPARRAAGWRSPRGAQSRRGVPSPPLSRPQAEEGAWRIALEHGGARGVAR